MSFQRIARRVLSGKWMVQREYAEAMKVSLHHWLRTGDSSAFMLTDDDRPAFEKVTNYFRVDKYSFEESASASTNDRMIAVHDIKGSMTKEDFCGDPGMDTIGRMIQLADAQPNIIAHVLDMDTPGGEASGMFELMDVISNTTKPVIAYGTLAASAGMGIASAADEIYGSSESASFGSVGVMVSIVNFDKMDEEDGIKLHYYYADTSPDKNKAYHEAYDGDGKRLIAEDLNPLDEMFMSRIRAQRKNVKDTALTGKTFYAKEAVELGLIDGIADFGMALSRALELGNEKANLKAA